MERPHAILFDVDGTLVETGGAGGESWRRAFRDLYEVEADVKLFSEVGETDPAVGRQTFEGVFGHPPEPAEMARLMTARLGHICASVAESPGYRVLPGVESTLERLAADGYLLGLTTGNVEAAAFAKLHRGGLHRFFCFGGYGSDSADRGELTRVAIRRAEDILGLKLDTCRVLVVGDTPKDVSAARAAGATAVAVATGHYSQADLREAGAHYVLATLEQPLPGVVEAVA
jgi:phosphoglycolate phosphatase-like HAD superfamily hydrolase